MCYTTGCLDRYPNGITHSILGTTVIGILGVVVSVGGGAWDLRAYPRLKLDNYQSLSLYMLDEPVTLPIN